MNWSQRILHRPFFIKLLNWEYWSFNTVYVPILPVWFLLCARARSFFFFSASNPTIDYGGFLMESKKAIYDIIPEEYYPKTIYFPLPCSPEAVVEEVKQRGFNYPLIGKPDVGGRGRGVKKLANENELRVYAASSPLDFLVQEYVPFAREVGIFYYRYPGSEMGHVTGVVQKEFLGVIGDGRSTIRQLLLLDKRFILQLPVLERMYGEGLEAILPNGEKKELVPYGNHARGAKFLDDSHLVDATFVRTIDGICKRIDGFYYGRLDIRYKDWTSLREGRDFSIIELNGAGSEPTHMYDPKHSLFFAWKEIIRHWFILFRVSRLNHKKGVPYLTFMEGRKMFRDNTEFERKVAQMYP
ncbi:hypothetical protein KJS94_06575 [Flavihumibacter rivuli]|uniref:hypothetical protein n=1 Tax=Flavihumibacter rivuli TaxID=2838156 RepID=UPI001BDECE42|nr:hypothetical protein [Flavihumibacter rivuli]ULQ57861.1 hypothetical protein KJS94_06575 [Flavihumibacter rivuli]